MSAADTPISPDVINDKIVTLRNRLSAVEDELDRLRAELEWWETGQRLFGGGTPPAEAGSEADPAGVTASAESPNSEKPTLRNAIREVLGQEPRKTWKSEAVIEELQRRGWIPSGDNAAHHVRSMLAQMHRKGQARRMGRGMYRLPPEATTDSS